MRAKPRCLRRMKDNMVGIYEPTFHPNYDTLVVGSVQFHTFDLGGHKSSRQLWRNYWEDIDGIVFLVDTVDSRRFEEAKKGIAQPRKRGKNSRDSDFGFRK